MAKRYKTGGRAQGTPNKVTTDIREAYQMLINNNIENLEVWLQKAAQKDPLQALKIIIEISEYVIPKLAKVDTDMKLQEPDILKKEIAANFDKLFTPEQS